MGELLAPVGNLEMLQAAIDAGADAVFLAGPNYGARAKDASFSIETLKGAVEMAHLYGVRVFVTLNTLIKESEWENCTQYIDQLAALTIDALIVQDLGVLKYCSEAHPHLPLHASTQMAISDLMGIEAAKQLGLKRVVLARETSLNEAIAWQSAGVPLEVFVHGALCYAYSGQCLLSGIQGGRSGNRGQCAQPCRLSYRLDGEAKGIYAMSMKDLSSLDHVKALSDNGIASFKIEGRLRSSDYVYHTTKAYRAAIDGVSGDEIKSLGEQMYRAFNREYTGGHLLADPQRLNLELSSNKGEIVGKTLKSTQFKLNLQLEAPIYKGDGLKVAFDEQSKGIEVFNIYTEQGVVLKAEAGQRVAIDFNGIVPDGSVVYRTRSKELTDVRTEAIGTRRILIEGVFEARLNQRMTLKMTDGNHVVEVQSPEPITEALKAAASTEQVEQSLKKLGDTIYSWKQLDIQMDDKCFLPKAALNGLRRDGMEALNQARLSQFNAVEKTGVAKTLPSSVLLESHAQYKAQSIPSSHVRPWHVSVLFAHHIQGVFTALAKANLSYESIRLFMPEKLYVEAIEAKRWTQEQKDVMAPELSPFIKHYPKFQALPEHVGISHFSQISSYKGSELSIGISSTVMNLEALRQWQHIGVKDVLASVELAPKELYHLVQHGIRVMVYGQLPAMYTRTCPKIARGVKCSQCTGHFTLEGKNGQSLQVHCDKDLLVYWTQRPIYREGDWPLKMVQFVDEAQDETYRVLLALFNGESLEIEALEAYQRPVF